MKKIKLSFLGFVLFLFAQFNICYASDKDSLSYIDKLLEATEAMGTSNPEQFAQNLVELTTLKNKFNPFQKDLFDYLTYYQQGYNGNFNDSLKNFNNLFNRSKIIEIKFRTKLKIANIHIISREIISAYNSIDYALNMINQIDDIKLKQLGYSISSIFYHLVDENELSTKFSQLMLGNSPTSNDKCIANSLIARIQLRQAQEINSEIDSLIKTTIGSCEEIDNYVYSNLLKMDWLKYLLNASPINLNATEFVLGKLLESEEKLEETKYKILINIKNGLLAKTYSQLGDVENSLFYANLTIEQDKSIGSTLHKIDVLQILIDHNKNMGEYEQAFHYLLEKNNTEINYYNQQQTKLMAYQTVKHNNLAKTQEIKFLSHENKVLSLEMDIADKASINHKLIILFLGALASFILLWGYKNKKTQQMYKYLSETDSMTEIYNRKGLKDFLKDLLTYSKKHNKTIAYAIFDLDHFKKINDKFGHIIGDWAIKAAIKKCQSIQNNKVTYGRIGGEEFAIIMRDSTSEELTDFAEDCRKKLIGIETSETGHSFVITASFGVTSTDVSGYFYSQLMKDADKAMYDAKIAGRNAVVNYQENTIIS